MLLEIVGNTSGDPMVRNGLYDILLCSPSFRDNLLVHCAREYGRDEKVRDRVERLIAASTTSITLRNEYEAAFNRNDDNANIFRHATLALQTLLLDNYALLHTVIMSHGVSVLKETIAKNSWNSLVDGWVLDTQNSKVTRDLHHALFPHKRQRNTHIFDILLCGETTIDYDSHTKLTISARHRFNDDTLYLRVHYSCVGRRDIPRDIYGCTAHRIYGFDFVEQSYLETERMAAAFQTQVIDTSVNVTTLPFEDATSVVNMLRKDSGDKLHTEMLKMVMMYVLPTTVYRTFVEEYKQLDKSSQ